MDPYLTGWVIACIRRQYRVIVSRNRGPIIRGSALTSTSTVSVRASLMAARLLCSANDSAQLSEDNEQQKIDSTIRSSMNERKAFVTPWKRVEPRPRGAALHRLHTAVLRHDVPRVCQRRQHSRGVRFVPQRRVVLQADAYCGKRGDGKNNNMHV